MKSISLSFLHTFQNLLLTQIAYHSCIQVPEFKKKKQKKDAKDKFSSFLHSTSV